MKASRLALLASAPLLVTGPADAGFTGIKVVGKPNPFGLLVCNVYATFDRPGQDLFLTAFGTPASPMNISVVGGTFYQNGLGGDRAPSAALVQDFPSLAYDSFVTIGVKMVGAPGGQPSDATRLSPGWPGFGPSRLGTIPGGTLFWAVTPGDAQSDPFNPNFVNGNGQVLIGQFSTANGTGFSGMFRIQVRSNNVTTAFNVSFFHVPGPGALALLATSGLWQRTRRRRQ